MKTIELTQGKVAIVDDEDFEALNAHSWQAHREGRAFYAVRKAPPGQYPRQIRMHAVIANTPHGMQTDHINGAGLDNRRENLRVSTVLQNLHNHTRKKQGCSSRFRGVHWNNRQQVWIARIAVEGVRIQLGSFSSEECAAAAYDRAGRGRNLTFFTPNLPEDWRAGIGHVDHRAAPHTKVTTISPQ